MDSTERQDIGSAFQQLFDACGRAETALQAASAHMQNRGLKYLFKRFAQMHKHCADQIAQIAQTSGDSLHDASGITSSLRRGWNDIRIALIVGRADRQNAAIRATIAPERELVNAYEKALQLRLPEVVQAVIQSQYTEIQEIDRWLQRLAAPEQWAVRLYEESERAAAAVDRLAKAGVESNEVEVVPLHDIVEYETHDAEERTHSTVDATLVGSLIGAALGAVAGAITGYVVPLYVPSVPDIASTLWMSTLFWGVIGILVGASFGGFFGLLLGRGVSEDDATVVEMTLEWNAYVVSVHTNAENASVVSRILQMKHQREVGTMPPQAIGKEASA